MRMLGAVGVMLAVLAINIEAQPTDRAPATLSPTALAAIDDSAHAAFRRFVWDWRRIHRASENARDVARDGGRRRTWWPPHSPWMVAAACTSREVAMLQPGHRESLHWRIQRFEPASGLIGACPSNLVAPVDEVRADGSADGQLLPRYRRLAQSIRADLLRALHALDASAQHQAALVSSLLVLMELDQEDPEAAQDVAMRCGVSASWCALLRRFAILRGRPVGADAPWETDSHDGWQWWLSDPLWTAVGNERRAENFVRRTELAIRRPMSFDEFYNWDPRVRGEAIAAAIERYGMPDYQWAMGSHHDKIMWADFVHGPPVRSITPFLSMEYFRDRVALVPPDSVLARPFAGIPWSVVPPADDAIPWRPRESMRLPFGLVELPGRVALFRRDSVAMVATAVAVPATAREAPQRLVRLLASPAPEQLDTLASRPLGSDRVLALHGAVSDSAAVIGIEYLPDTVLGSAAGRLRLGLTMPRPLHKTDSLPALAPPVLLRADVGGSLPLRRDSDAFAALAPSHEVRRGDPLVLYWETYGVPADSTVTHGVWLQRTDRPGLLVRLGVRFALRPDANAPVAVSWTEQGLGARAVAIPSVHTTAIGRSMQVQTTQLPPGRYVLGVSVSRAERVILVATTDVQITP